MKKYLSIVFIFGILVFNACKKANNDAAPIGQTETTAAAEEKTTLTAQEFSDKISQTPDAEIIDVRTPEEFTEGHIANAKNFDINGNFEQEISNLDKSKPVFVYCLSGGRSANAAEVLKNSGFSKVYNLEGGMMAWRNANLPETKDSSVAKNAKSGMTKQQFDAAIDSDKIVLVDFNAVWCAPCQKMKPYVEKISETMKDKVKVLSIDADENSELAQQMKIEGLPTIQIYKNGKKVWENMGYVPEDVLLEKLK